MKKEKRKKWVAILQTWDGFSKFHWMDEPTPTIQIQWLGYPMMNFKCMTIDTIRKEAFYLLNG